MKSIPPLTGAERSKQGRGGIQGTVYILLIRQFHDVSWGAFGRDVLHKCKTFIAERQAVGYDGCRQLSTVDEADWLSDLHSAERAGP